MQELVTDRAEALRDRADALYALVRDLAPSPVARTTDIDAMEALLKSVTDITTSMYLSDMPRWREAIIKRQGGHGNE